MKTNFEQRLENLISSNQSTDELLDSLEDSEQIQVKRLPEVVYDTVASKLPQKETLSPDLVDDYEFTRSILRGLLLRGTSALEGAMTLAAETESPNAYRNVSDIMKTVSDIAGSLMSVHDTVKPKAPTKIDKQINIQNNVAKDTDIVTANDPKVISQFLDAMDDD
jgi:hypothetical protein